MHRRLVIPVVLLLTANRVALAAAPGPDFAREIRPLLNEHCLACHGPDGEKREAELRLDELQNAFQQRGDQPAAIIPGNSSASPLFQRITAADPAERMPPLDSGHALTKAEIDVIRRWIDEGAQWSRHWAYQPVHRPPLPDTINEPWCANPIDAFTLEKMREQGFQPARDASAEMLIRRVTWDFTGLPPTPEEVHSFVNDPSPAAYERVVERLLASPRYGERLAIPWLDAARYADTHGYHADSHRDMWLWRAWVIEAFNRNMPFDQFTMEQLAGDLLPGTTDAQRLATGFHRNTMLNAENGAIAEEYLVEYVADRVETTATVWLAQTIQCARCHDHKYDSYTQRDYYQLFAYFNNVSENGLDGRQGNAEPLLSFPTPQQQRELEGLQQQQSEVEARIFQRRELAVATRADWEQRLQAENRAVPSRDALWHVTFDEPGGEFASSADGRDVLKIAGEPQWLRNGKFQGALLLNGSTQLQATQPLPQSQAGLSVSLWVFPTTRDRMRLVACGQPTGAIRRWQLILSDGRLIAQVLLDGSETPWLVASAQPLATRRWQHVLLTCNALTSATPVELFVDGKPVERAQAEQPQALSEIAGQPLQIGAVEEAGFRGMIDDVRCYSRVLNSTEAELLAGMDPIGEVLQVAVERRTREQTSRLLNYYLEHFDADYQGLKQLQDELEVKRRGISLSIATAMVMNDQQPRPTFILERGNYRFPKEEVTAAPPGMFARPTQSFPANRLGLARWIVDPQNPLTARVAVNRIWQLHFGAGLVRTTDDFGVRGELPSHPELLDWLAAEFVASGWDMKQLQRMIVLSATYRQTSEVEARQFQHDPENRWLARSARQRLPAELIRDGALATSGLLQERVGGPSVYPYQPPGLWEELAYDKDQYTAQRYLPSQGGDLYRRSLYTFWKRTSPPPALLAFDAPNREKCLVRRGRSNTALQALVLMNDPTFVEAARQMAERVLREAVPTFAARLERCYYLIYGRAPQAREAELLESTWHEVYSRMAADRNSAQALLSTGESTAATDVDTAELATWTIVASLLMNTDEAITRP